LTLSGLYDLTTLLLASHHNAAPERNQNNNNSTNGNPDLGSKWQAFLFVMFREIYSLVRVGDVNAMF